VTVRDSVARPSFGLTATLTLVLASFVAIGLPLAEGIETTNPASVSASGAAVSWVHLSKAYPAPKARQFYGMEYDPKVGALVLFGGLDTFGNPIPGTWEFANGTWTKLHLSVSPAPRSDEGLVYDPARGGLILFGGVGAHGPLNDTWLFTASGWHQLHPVLSPPPTGASSMAYDAADGYILMTYALRGQSTIAEAWTFNATTWTNISAHVGTPPPNVWFDTAYDSASGDVLFYGGSRGCGNPSQGIGLTWTFGHGKFRNVTAGQPLTPENTMPSLAMAYDPTLKGVVMFSGYTIHCVATNTTYLFLDGHWTNLTKTVSHSPPPRWNARLASLPKLGLVLFSGNEAPIGGTNQLHTDTWVLEQHSTTHDTAQPLNVAPHDLAIVPRSVRDRSSQPSP
jgi:hypothetical protein